MICQDKKARFLVLDTNILHHGNHVAKVSDLETVTLVYLHTTIH